MDPQDVRTTFLPNAYERFTFVFFHRCHLQEVVKVVGSEPLVPVIQIVFYFHSKKKEKEKIILGNCELIRIQEERNFKL